MRTLKCVKCNRKILYDESYFRPMTLLTYYRLEKTLCATSDFDIGGKNFYCVSCKKPTI